MEPNNPLALAGLEKGKAPERRIAKAADAQTLVSTLLQAGDARSFFNYQVKGMIDGFPPKDPAVLAANAMSYVHNVNWLEGKARCQAARVPYYDLFSGARYYAEVETEYGSDEQRGAWSRTITEEFHETLRAYRGFDFHMQAMIKDFNDFGRGFLMFRDRRDWQFYHFPQHRVFVPDGTECFSDDLEVLVMVENMKVHKLWGHIKDKAKASRTGWKTDAVVEAIDKATPQQRGTQNQNSSWEDLEQRIKDKDICEGTTSSTVPVAHIYVREFSGRVSYLIIDRNERGRNDGPQGFLYEKIGRYQSFQECLSTFFFETDDGSWNGARGLGNDIYSSIQAKNNLKNSAMDMTRLRTSLMLQAKTASAAESASLIAIGAMTVIPHNFEVQQSTVLGDVKAPMDMDRALDVMLDQNTGTYRQRNERQEGNPPTLGQVQLDYQHSAILSSSAVNRFYNQLDPHYAEIYRRLSDPNQAGDYEGAKAARLFQKRCRDRGVPQMAIMRVKSVRAYRNAGNGSMFMRQQAVTSTASLVPKFPEEGQEAWLEDAVSVLTNQTMMRRWLPKPPEPGNAEDHAATAALENGVLKLGAPVFRTKTQNDMIHLVSHIGAMDSAASTVPQTNGQSAPEVLTFLHSAGPHAAVHLQALSKDPSRKQAVQQFEKHLKELGGLADDLQKHLEKQAQEQQKQNQMREQATAAQNGQDPEMQLEAAKAKSHAEIATFKAQHAAQLKAMTAQHNMQVQDLTTRQNMVIQDATAASDIHRKNAQAKHEPAGAA